jgi:amidase
MIQAMDAKRIGAVELLDASIAHAHHLKAKLNAVVAEDPDAARAAAKAIDERRAKGETAETIGLLAGVPMTIKDTLDVDGMPASAGLKSFLGRAAGDAAAVGRAT